MDMKRANRIRQKHRDWPERLDPDELTIAQKIARAFKMDPVELWMGEADEEEEESE